MRTSLLFVLILGCTPSLLTDDDDTAADDTPPEAIDLIVVMDESGSMDRIHTEIEIFLPRALSSLADLGSSVRVGVTTSDLSTNGNGRAGNLRSSAAINSGECARSDTAMADSGAADWDATLREILDVGLNGAGDERPMHAAALALCKAQDEAFWVNLATRPETDPVRAICAGIPTADRDCNRGELRAEAVKAVLIISDEGDATEDDSFLPSSADVDACFQEHLDDPLFGECDCRIEWWTGFFAEFDVPLFVIGPTYQTADSTVDWCDGAERTISGPCNPFVSNVCSIDFQQRGACLTGGEWWPLETTASDPMSCDVSNFEPIGADLTARLADL